MRLADIRFAVKPIVAALVLLLVAAIAMGCAGMSSPQMSPEQLKAAAADKNFSAMCNTFTGFGGVGKSVVVNVDQRVVINGSISVDPNCVVTMTNAATIKPEPAK
jgi:hypothetical protein